MALRPAAAAAWCAAAALASPFEPHLLPKSGPWFEGWFTRITDPAANRSVAVIVGSFQPKGSAVMGTTWVAALVAHPDGTMTTEQVFPNQSSVSITSRGHPVTADPPADQPAVFAFTSSVGGVSFNDSTSYLDFAFPSGLTVTASLHQRVPWDPSCPDTCGPEGWVGKLPQKELPTHYFVQTLASRVEYSLNGERGVGFAHQEENYGNNFPSAWVWAQGVTADGAAQFVLTGGEFVIAGVTIKQWIIAYRGGGRAWTFRNVDLDHIDAAADGCNATLRLSARTAVGDARRAELAVVAPQGSFSDPLYFPTPGGFSNQPGSVESYAATATVQLYEKGGSAPAATTVFTGAALEFGGTYVCPA